MVCRLLSLILAMLVLTSSLLLAPLQAGAAHAAADVSVASAISEHGHFHAEQQSDAHAAIDHMHDAPCPGAAAAAPVNGQQPNWTPALHSRWLLRARQGMDRPPKLLS